MKEVREKQEQSSLPFAAKSLVVARPAAAHKALMKFIAKLGLWGEHHRSRNVLVELRKHYVQNRRIKDSSATGITAAINDDMA